MSPKIEELPSAPAQKPVAFADRDPGFTSLGSLEVALSLLSLGIGRFWLASKLRRYLWSNTKILGHPLVYDGDARIPLLQFAAGAAALVGIGLALDRLESRVLGEHEAYLFLAAAISAFAYWRAMTFADWRYRLNHTLWRGRRFRAEGSVVAYFLRTLGWGAASLSRWGSLGRRRRPRSIDICSGIPTTVRIVSNSWEAAPSCGVAVFFCCPLGFGPESY